MQLVAANGDVDEQMLATVRLRLLTYESTRHTCLASCLEMCRCVQMYVSNPLRDLLAYGNGQHCGAAVPDRQKNRPLALSGTRSTAPAHLILQGTAKLKIES